MNFKVGLLVIATGKYKVFLSQLIESAKKLFLKNHNIHFYIFTDSDAIPVDSNAVTICEIEHDNLALCDPEAISLF